MKDLYIKPEAKLREFDIVDVITGSGEDETTQKSGDSQEPGWSIIV